MPSRNQKGLFLSDCHGLGRTLRVTCNWCRQRRFYACADVITLLGDHEVDSLYQRLPCETCGKRDYMEVMAVLLNAQERQGLTIRRLVRVRTIRKPVWREEPL